MMSFQVLAAGMPVDDAKALAEKHVPAESVYVRTEDDDGRFEVKYISKDEQEKYEIDISKTLQKVVSFTSERYKDEGAKTVVLTEKDAEKVVSTEIQDAQILSVTLKQDDQRKEYEVKFQTEEYYGTYDIDPQTGVILERDIHVGTEPTQTDAEGLLSYDKAVELALLQVPGATVTDIDLEREGDLFLYEIELYKDGYEYDLAFDAKTEKLLWNSNHKDDGWLSHRPDQSTQTTTYIGLEKAKEIALAKAPAGAIMKKCHLDYDDRKPVYEGELRSGNWEYEFEIDAVTGAILEWDFEIDD